jgi:NAD(P)-dependent dehydrogenase (short-subunit alcohol dehydrogenase family)
MNEKLKNRWALVTGSARGIGQQIALGLAQCSCNVIIHGRKKENAEKTLAMLKDYNVKVGIVEGELDNTEEIKKICNDAERIAGHIDILYNNAAVMSRSQKIWTIPVEEWKKIFDINFFAIIEICSFFIPKMLEKGYGRVTNVTSGIQNQPDLAPYSVSKAAIDKYTLDIAAELKGTNVLISYIDPGWLRTDLGSQRAPYPVETVLPGIIVPALLEDFGPNGERFYAQDYKNLKL